MMSWSLRKKNEDIFCAVYFVQRKFFLDICVLSQCIVYWIHFACSSWTSSADELFLERNASATTCSWAVRHVTALIVFHYFTSVFITMCKQQRCWKLKAFNVIFQHLDVLHTLLVFLILNISIKQWKKQYFINYSLFF